MSDLDHRALVKTRMRLAPDANDVSDEALRKTATYAYARLDVALEGLGRAVSNSGLGRGFWWLAGKLGRRATPR